MLHRNILKNCREKIIKQSASMKHCVHKYNYHILRSSLTFHKRLHVFHAKSVTFFHFNSHHSSLIHSIPNPFNLISLLMVDAAVAHSNGMIVIAISRSCKIHLSSFFFFFVLFNLFCNVEFHVHARANVNCQLVPNYCTNKKQQQQN